MSSGARGGTWCAVPNCSMNTKLKTVSLFGFPKEPERCKKWILNIGRNDLLIVDHIKLRYMKVCGYHFEEKMFVNDLKNRLHNHSVPTLNIPGEEKNMEIIGNVHGKKREYSSDDRQLPDAKKIKILDMHILQRPSTSSTSLSEKDSFKDINYEEGSTSHNLNVALQTSSTLSSHTPRKEKLRLKLRSERKKNSRARENLQALRISSSESEVEELEETLC